MRVADLLARARSAHGDATVYKLGAGGMVATARHPANMDQQCDCSGFVCWALGRSRQTTHPLYARFNGGWINTDGMVHDATHATGFFSQIPAARAGCLVVYPGGGGKVGHVGIVTELASDGKAVVGHVGIVTELASDGKAVKVIHCSSGNYRKTNDAIQETGLAVFQRIDAIYAWYEGIDPPPAEACP